MQYFAKNEGNTKCLHVIVKTENNDVVVDSREVTNCL